MGRCSGAGRCTCVVEGSEHIEVLGDGSTTFPYGIFLRDVMGAVGENVVNPISYDTSVSPGQIGLDLSADAGNILTVNPDGLYAPASTVSLSTDAGNTLEFGTDGGLYDGPPAISVDTENHLTTGSDDALFARTPGPEIATCSLVLAATGNTVPTGTQTAMTWGTAVANVGGMWDQGTDATRITIARPGVYLLTYFLTWDDRDVFPDIPRASFLRVNAGSAQTATAWYVGNNGSVSTLHGSISLNLAAGDYVRLFAYHNAGSDLSIFGGNDQYTTITATLLVPAGG